MPFLNDAAFLASPPFGTPSWRGGDRLRRAFPFSLKLSLLFVIHGEGKGWGWGLGRD